MSAAVYFAVRIALGGVLVLASVQKLRTLRQFISGLGRYGLLPSRLNAPTAVGVVVLEAVTGVLLLANVAAPIAVSAAVGLFAVFSGVLAISLIRGKEAPCFCFGAEQTEPISFATLFRAALLLGAGVLAVLTMPSDSAEPLSSTEIVPALTLAAAIVVAVRLVDAFPLAWRAFRTRPTVSPTATPRISFRSEALEFSLKRAVAYRRGASDSWTSLDRGRNA